VSQILVIDDDSGIRDLLRDLLEEAGHQVRCASDGLKGRRDFEIHGAELVITDVLMPEKEGCSVIVDIRELAPEVKVIAMSGGQYNAADAYLQLAQEVGADEVLEKPFRPMELLRRVESLLADRQRS
jgi:two-component system chemotaxis response regulator CheY